MYVGYIYVQINCNEESHLNIVLGALGHKAIVQEDDMFNYNLY